MVTDTEGIVLRQVKTVNGRVMLVIFSRKFGKISVGANQVGGAKTKSALATRPFTYANFELFKSRESYNLNKGQVIRSYFELGEDLDKFMAASYALELTDRLLPEEVPQPKLFVYLTEFLSVLEKRPKKHDTLLLAYMVKALDRVGVMPETGACVFCGGECDDRSRFSVGGGGMVCKKCAKEISGSSSSVRAGEASLNHSSQDRKFYRGYHDERACKSGEEALIYDVNFDIINILNYFKNEPFSKFEKIALQDGVSGELTEILKRYMAYHLEISDLKSEFVTV